MQSARKCAFWGKATFMENSLQSQFLRMFFGFSGHWQFRNLWPIAFEHSAQKNNHFLDRIDAAFCVISERRKKAASP
jgi:hypothetical protein